MLHLFKVCNPLAYKAPPVYQRLKGTTTFLVGLYIVLSQPLLSQEYSIARVWNEELLNAIRHDLSRPTVHARNLFHISAAMYDAWAAYDEQAHPYLLGQTVGDYYTPYEGFLPVGDIEESRKAAISFAAYRILVHRFKNSPQADSTLMSIDLTFDSLGYDKNYTSLTYQDGDGRALGNYIAHHMIQYGLTDGANEEEAYANKYYRPINSVKSMNIRGNRAVSDPNRWQPLALDLNRDKNGSVLDGVPSFLSPEWGHVVPFSLGADDRTLYEKDGHPYIVYHDPGPPPYLDTLSAEEIQDYQWGFMLVSQWGSHLSPTDTTMWDTSPGSIGNIPISQWPKNYKEMRSFYKKEGGDGSKGHKMNPLTGAPYQENKVLRANYARVLAEFWADGPDSETPPGHWFTILNYVSDHPQFARKYRGEGVSLNRLDWDIKSYFVLGGAMHDAAISAWSVKGYYDYVRPVTALRYMAELGQSTDPALPNYHKNGIPLIDGFSALVKKGDPLTLSNNCIDLIKLYTWRGHTYVNDIKKDFADVGWILAKDWWPYQRQDFITPPFAGYVSGHSTFSRAAAEVMTLITGSPYFPGGMGTFKAKKNEYLKFESGPTEDIELQWATYRDASDQTSLSRIWGGIHPPADDIPGRRIGLKVGKKAVKHAEVYFNIESKEMIDLTATKDLQVTPKIVRPGSSLKIKYAKRGRYNIEIKDLDNRVYYSGFHKVKKKTMIHIPLDLHEGVYNIVLQNDDTKVCHRIQVISADPRVTSR